MSTPRASTVVTGQVVVTADPLRTVEAIGIAGDRVVAAGTLTDVDAAAAPGARRIDAGATAVIPGLHDFHLHLVGMARARAEVLLDDAESADEVTRRLTDAAGALPNDSWLRGRGWLEGRLDPTALNAHAALAHRPALVYSHDAHSAWASPAALREARIGPPTADPPGGRIERAADGTPSGVLREHATDLVEQVAGRLRGTVLDAALDEVVGDLLGWGVTGATDAGDTSPDNGVGPYAAVGDRASLLLGAGAQLDGRLRLTVNVPARAIEAAAALGLRTGASLAGAATVRAGWAKAYADGALGSRTAALFAPYTCGDARDTGMVRLTDPELDALFAAGRRNRIGLAVHAIGDRAVAAVLDAIARAPARPADAPGDRIEHLQLLRPADAHRLAELGVTASVQPVHCAADRAMVEDCWADRADLAYPYRALTASGALLAFGSDAPIESPNPWHGVFAAVHRRHPGDGTPDWQTHQAIGAASALAAYTLGPARAMGRSDEGHLLPGARADLAVLDVDLATLLEAGDELAAVRSVLTLVGGAEVHRS
jgi:hypothetical protein